MKIEESNRMIAEFMGLMVYNTYAEMQAVPLDELKPWILPEQCTYHTSWDQLMPVVERIRGVGFANEVQFGISNGYSMSGAHNWSVNISANITRWKLKPDGTMVWPNESYKTEMDSFWIHRVTDLISAVYQAVIKFIEWYNANGFAVKHN